MGTLSGKIASSGLTPVYVNSAVNASAGKLYQCDTTSAAFTVTLPTGSTGSVLRFVDDAGTWGTHNLTIAPAATQTIQGISGNGSLVCDLSGAYVEMTWDATNSQWCVQTTGFQYGPTYSPGNHAGIVPVAGLPGFTDGSNAAAGVVGEYISANSVGVAVSIGSNTTAASISLTAGDWDVDGVLAISVGSLSSPSYFHASISKTNNGIDSSSSGGYAQIAAFTSVAPYIPTGRRRISLSATTPIYLIGAVSGGSGTGTYNTDSFIQARRVR